MTILSRLEAWKENGSITPVQFDAISALVRKDRFSVFVELNALLYLGVLSFIAGVAWSIQAYFADLGDAAILSSLRLLSVLCFSYCFRRAPPYSSGEVESAEVAADYVLYLGCLTFALDLGYAETRLHLLQEHWDFYFCPDHLGRQIDGSTWRVCSLSEPSRSLAASASAGLRSSRTPSSIATSGSASRF